MALTFATSVAALALAPGGRSEAIVASRCAGTFGIFAFPMMLILVTAA